MKNNEVRVQLPEFFFQGATLVFSPKKSLTDFDVVFPKVSENEDRSMSAGEFKFQFSHQFEKNVLKDFKRQ